MTRAEAINYIENRPWQGSSLDLSRMQKLMAKLNNPQKDLKCIHVAGTNGKGSCCAMLTSILMEAGYKVGTYTSPHLIKYEERFTINNQKIQEKTFIRLTNKVKKAASSLDFEPRVFEILTAIAFLYFKEQKVDLVVLEVGMGGRLDATNIIEKPLVAVIMNIGLEHTEILGDTLAKIAKEKAGIIKDKTRVVAYKNTEEVKQVISDICLAKEATLKFADFSKIQIIQEEASGQIFNYGKIKNIHLSLLGKHQLKNATVVIEAVNCLKELGYQIDTKTLKKGLNKATWAARLVILNQEPLFILDGAHNLQCAEALAQSLPQLLKKKKAILLWGMLKDKDYQQVLDLLLPFAKEFICVAPKTKRALSGDELTKLVINKGGKATSCFDVKQGISLALNKADKTPIVALGSLYLAGEVLANFKACYKTYLRKKYRDKRAKLSKKVVTDASNIIVERIKQTKEYQNAKKILIYKAKGKEVDLSSLTKDKTKIFAYPKCVDGDLLALIPNSEEDFEVGAFGIEEPIVKQSKVMAKPDLVICPLISFDEKGNRLGQGKGYYDRYLSKHQVTSIGVAYEIQKNDNLPIEDKDVPLKVVCSESNTYC